MKLTGKNLGFAILLLLGVIIAFAPVRRSAAPVISQAELVKQLQNKSIYVQPEELADWIINKDPGYQLVDIRSQKDYETYHIPGNIHLPLANLNKQNLDDILDNEKMIILASNGNTLAGQAWVLLKQMGYEEVYILAGGLNHWVKAFNNPQPPTAGATDDEQFLYQFRKSAGAVMMGKSIAVDDASPASKPKPVKRKRRKAKKAADEGC